MDYLHDSHRSMFAKLLPSAIGAMLSETVASLIDTIILSYYLGPDMLSTISICMPIYMFVNTLSMLIVSGGATLFAQSLGREDKEDAQRYYTCSIVLMVLCGAILTVGGLVFTKQIMSALGASGSVLEPTVQYGRVLFSFMIPLCLYQQLMVYVRFDGAPILSLISTVVCAVVNLVLDVLFVGVFLWGPGGAALATCLAYTVAMLINAAHLLQKNNGLIFRRGSMSGARVGRVLKTGIPLSVTQLGMAVGTSLFNIRIMDVGGPMYLDVYGVITQLSVVAMALYEGIAQACQPILAACFGAGDRKRTAQTIRYGFVMEIIAMTFATVLYIFGAGFVANLFSMQEAEIHAAAVGAIRIYALSLLFTGFNTIIIYHFQVKEYEIHATGISLLSGTILPVAFLYLLTLLFSVRGIWWCYLIAQGLTLILSAVLYTRDKRMDSQRRSI
ncbi:MAG: hypothetical protein IK132_04110 [Clostridia bacterium]|nr:hypothetical protein [Clostridia bacterium]